MRVLIILFALTFASTAMAERRVALVIGNSNYAHASQLSNPQNDARAIGTKLSGLGFEVFLHENLGGQAFRVALGGFAEEALHSDLAVVFYAGHGIEMGGRNYLIPIDAEMNREATAEFEAISLDNILTAVRNAGKFGLVMLDACRDNPFSNKMERKNGTRALSRGLASITLDGEAGTLVSFAAQAGYTAADGEGQNSPYTEALLELLGEPDLEVGALFQRVTKVVKDKTGGLQKPMYSIQPPEDLVYLVPQDVVASQIATPTLAPTVAQAPSRCDALYSAAAEAKACFAYEAYFESCREHSLAPIADGYIKNFCKIEDAEHEVNPPKSALETSQKLIIKTNPAGSMIARNRRCSIISLDDCSDEQLCKRFKVSFRGVEWRDKANKFGIEAKNRGLTCGVTQENQLACTNDDAEVCSDSTEIVYRIGINRVGVQVRELDPATGRYVEKVQFNPATDDAPSAYAAVKDKAGTRFRVALAEGVTSWQVVNSLKSIDVLKGEVAEVPAEGTLGPDSYEVKLGDERAGLLARMQDQQARWIADAWEGRNSAVPVDNPQDLLILASLIEKETGEAREREQVASVFVNRLNKNMRLQTDPTVIYGITKGEGILGRGLRRSELRAETPWNTYVIPALPPTPIANPGRASLLAAANPDETPYIFFVADGTGGHAFAVTLEEHNRNVAKWRKIEAEKKAAEGN